ncbi:MAG: type II methionyl aminopeptidase [Nanoarchaeota archaeon]
MKQFPNIMNPEDKEKWITAGKIASEVREWSKSLIIPGAKLLDIANAIEHKIREKGVFPAFPVNLSLNEIAAHYTPVLNDSIVLSDQILKVDIGVCYEGAIGDTAYTVDLSGTRTKLVEASHQALANAMKILKIGLPIAEIGRVVEETITSYGFQPIRNLSGHGIALYQIHTGPSIPNYDTKEKIVLEKGMIIAIEPFASSGEGRIKDGGDVVIFEEISHRPVRSPLARQMLRDIEEFQHVPFARRWLDEKYSVNKVSLALQQLKMNGNVQGHAPLVEISKGMVSQAEHTFLIDDVVVCLTK